MSMYTPDLSSLLRMLVETRATEVLATERAGPEGPWQAQLTVIEGQVTSCHVQSSVYGPGLLSGGEALGWLASQGNLLWERVASTPQRIVRASQAASPQPHAVPRRLARVAQGEVHAWSRKQRQVFALVDGSRSIERIAVILCQPSYVVEGIVHELQVRGVVAVETLTGELREEESMV